MRSDNEMLGSVKNSVNCFQCKRSVGGESRVYKIPFPFNHKIIVEQIVSLMTKGLDVHKVSQ